MLDALDILGPSQFRRIERAGDREPTPRPAPRWLAQQAVESGLAVSAVGAEIAESPARFRSYRAVLVGIDAAVKRPRRARTVAPLQQPQRRAAGEREVQIKCRDQRRVQ